MIFTEDVITIFGPRKWASRTDEILKANESQTLPPPITDVEAAEVSSSVIDADADEKEQSESSKES